MITRSLVTAAVLAALLVPLAASGQRTESRLVATSAGAVLGTLSGGYIAVSSIVAESRMGRYVHDVDDILGWRSMPVVTGASMGAALGAYSPRRLEAAALYGVAGLGAGALIGTGIGALVWEPPEGRWAGAAIGAGIGLMVGNVLGIMRPYRSAGGDADEPAPEAQAAGVPLMIRISF